MPLTKRRVEQITMAASIVVAVIGGVYGIVAFIDNRVERKLTEEATLKKIAELVRPSCIFDERGSILYDSGAMQSIEEIKLQDIGKEDSSSRLPFTIVVRPKRLLKDAPILSVLDTYVPDIKVERGEKFDWVYTIHHGGLHSTNNPFLRCRYRLEIL